MIVSNGRPSSDFNQLAAKSDFCQEPNFFVLTGFYKFPEEGFLPWIGRMRQVIISCKVKNFDVLKVLKTPSLSFLSALPGALYAIVVLSSQ